MAGSDRSSRFHRVFLVDRDGHTVSWVPVHPGIQQDNRLEVKGEKIQGRVIVLGHQLVDDGSNVIVSQKGAGK